MSVAVKRDMAFVGRDETVALDTCYVSKASTCRGSSAARTGGTHEHTDVALVGDLGELLQESHRRGVTCHVSSMLMILMACVLDMALDDAAHLEIPIP